MAQATIRRPPRMARANRLCPLNQIPTVSQTMQRTPAAPPTRLCWLPTRPRSLAEISLELAARSITVQFWFTKRPRTISSLSLSGILRRTPLRLAAQQGRRSARQLASPANQHRLEPVQRRILARSSDLGNRRLDRPKQRRPLRHHNRKIRLSSK